MVRDMTTFLANVNRINACSWAPRWFFHLEEIQQLCMYSNIIQVQCLRCHLNMVVIAHVKVQYSHSVSDWTLLCHISNELRVILAHFCSITAGSLLLPFWGFRAGKAWLGSLTPYTHIFPQADFLYSRSRHFPDITWGTFMSLFYASVNSLWRRRYAFYFSSWVYMYVRLLCFTESS